MKKALLVTTVSGFVPQFEMNNVRILQQMGYEVHYASNYDMPSYGTDNHRLDGTGIIRHQIDFVRSPYSLKNRSVYRQLKSLMEREHFDLVHCHTPMGGVMARLAAHATDTGPVIYTAHGFHFYKGAPWVNWLCYYPMERFLSRYTDQQLCINKEDYERAKKFHAEYVDYVPGVGIDLEKVNRVQHIDINAKKRSLGISPDKKILLSAGEMIKRKNHETTIRAFAQLEDPSLMYVICGHGELETYLRQLVCELGLENQVLFLGYRSDIFEIYQMADIYLFPSFQEGLPMALLEVMASGLPVICSDIRGSRDLMREDISAELEKEWCLCGGGALVKEAADVDAYVEAIRILISDPELLRLCGQCNAATLAQFTIQNIDKEMRRIYKRLEER